MEKRCRELNMIGNLNDVKYANVLAIQQLSLLNHLELNRYGDLRKPMGPKTK